MGRWKLGTRVVMAAAVAMLVGVVGLDIVVQVILDRELHQQLDRTIRQRAADIDQIAETAPRALNLTLQSDPVAIGNDVEVIGRSGALIARSRRGERILAPPDLIRSAVSSRRPQFATVRIGGKSLRMYVQPLEGKNGSGAGVVIVAASTDAVEDGLARARLLILIAGVAVVFVAAGVCLLVTRQALRPLARLSSEVMEVQRTVDPTRRVARKANGDELDQLAAALNGMLEALQRARETERRFLADASHEMRTPLTALRGNASYLAKHGADAEAFADLERDMGRLARLLDRLLVVAREDAAATPTESVSLAAIIQRFATDPRVEIGETTDLSVRGDADAIARAVTNLVENARLYGPSDQPITITTAHDATMAVITVTDRGFGIPVDDIDVATTRFWRGANSVGVDGSGLGLGLVRATAERHGGSLSIDGAAISIRLPADPKHSAVTNLSSGYAATDSEPGRRG